MIEIGPQLADTLQCLAGAIVTCVVFCALCGMPLDKKKMTAKQALAEQEGK